MPVTQSKYTNNGPVDSSKSSAPSSTSLKDKKVVVTGGAAGFGEAFVRTFVQAGADVTFGDINVEKGEALARELGERAAFVECDTTDWEQQLNLFKTAAEGSSRAQGQPHRTGVDVVIANAGITGADPVFEVEDDPSEPSKPDLKTIDVNVKGALYTYKLAQHFFHHQSEAADRDRCFIVTGSLAGYVDLPGSVQYSVSKWGMRGLLHSLRSTSHTNGIRINYIAPWFAETTILAGPVVEALTAKGVEFAKIDDCAAAAMALAINPSLNGRSLMIVPRSINSAGWQDAESDDFENGTLWHELQTIVLRTRQK